MLFKNIRINIYKQYIIKFFIIYLFINTSCTEKYSIEKITMFENNPNLFNISIEKIISLETCNDACLIGEINKIEYFRNQLYIFDKYHAKALFIYDNTGKLISKTQKGNGPGETIFPVGFYIDTLVKKMEMFYSLTLID
jgi:hypothetical protein